MTALVFDGSIEASEDLARRLADAGLTVERNVALSSLTTFRIGGPAAVMVRPSSLAEVESVATIVAETAAPALVVGQGSNLLVADDGWNGVVVKLDPDAMAHISAVGDGDDGSIVTAGGAVKLPVLARWSVARALSGLEWMVGVPGSVGGAVRMNAGGHGSDVASNLLGAHIVSLKTGVSRRIHAAELSLTYRQSAITADDVVVEAEFACQRGDRSNGDQELTDIVKWRREHQPGGANCGSVFTNPPGDSAGRLIDSAGLKGFRIGGASVSTKHANFIQADEHCRAADVWAVIVHVRSVVAERFGVMLHPEVRTAGFDATLDPLPTSAQADSAQADSAQPESAPRKAQP
jgi:UDP-N-acetylmuramate dehydrogenase